ncbi:adenylyl-sulfate kinase [Zunongwangia endophytica]|uniref:Adenylyl-sulfate kinase n=1 Tax=Zunongwangia endophytica TaxID=1808945 RepID=A0ABV8HCC0_9FLAO|nr:adenylyl-sulfate kinase [Zunongwangia endophytica]MDN3596235.1 adenylyl-sulfate kinase [Zunongwangia endophytica]
MKNIIPQDYHISRNDRASSKKHQSLVVWFTGLSGSGKSTLASLVENELYKRKIHTYSLDGDNIRGGINKGLGFSASDREENLRRIAEVARLFVDAGVLVIGAFISPLEEDRNKVKNIIGKDDFIEIFVDTSVEECEKRDVKGLYKKARAGEIKNFTGISAPYERPCNPDIIIKTESSSIEESINKVINYILPRIELSN